MLKFAQLRSKAEIFAEITRSYPKVGDMRSGWEIEKFDFKPPSDSWMDAFKPLATFKLELKSMPNLTSSMFGSAEQLRRVIRKRLRWEPLQEVVEIRRCFAGGPGISTAWRCATAPGTTSLSNSNWYLRPSDFQDSG